MHLAKSTHMTSIIIKRTFTATKQRYYFATILVVCLALGFHGCGDTASVNEEAQLASLTVNPGALQPAFSSNAFDYRVNVPTTADSITFRATPRDNGTTMTINGALTDSGQEHPVPLGAPGSSTTIRITLSAPSGTQNTYVVLVNRPVPLSSNPDLSALSVASTNLAHTLVPAFAPNTPNYTIEVDSTVDSVTVSATKADPNAAMTGSVTAGAGQASGQAPVTLNGAGSSTLISIIVAAPNGTTKEYRITVNRLLPSSNNNLSALTVTPGALSPSFTQSTVNYGVNVGNSVGSVTVSATKADPNAVLSGAIANPGAGQATGQATITLNAAGSSTLISITVTAQNGNTKEYRITVNRDSQLGR